MKHIKVFIVNKVSPAKIDETTYFNDQVIEALKRTVKEDYGKELPNF